MNKVQKLRLKFRKSIMPGWFFGLFIAIVFAWILYLDYKADGLTRSIFPFLNDYKADWNMWSAIGTILSAMVALVIAVFGYLESLKRDTKSKRKEAIEKIIIPLRKDLHNFIGYKWHTCHLLGRSYKLENLRLDFPLHYFWLDNKIKEKLEYFDLQWDRFEYLSHQEKNNFTKLIADITKNFLENQKISIRCFPLGEGHIEEAINNIHWSCTIGGKSGAAVTLHSLVLLNQSLTDYLNKRKEEKDIPNNRIDNVHFSMHSSSVSVKLMPQPTVEQSNALLSEIRIAIDKNTGVKQYQKEWQELHKNGLELLEFIDSWLSKQ
ncbi:MAG: hypothetical protein HUT38_02805 [Candidatus Paceibacter sp.]|nr:hypothetical protein [Candidatus Paceibacter sp.]